LAKLPGVGYPKILSYTTTLSAALRPDSGFPQSDQPPPGLLAAVGVFVAKGKK